MLQFDYRAGQNVESTVSNFFPAIVKCSAICGQGPRGITCNSLSSVGRLTPSIMARLPEKSWAFPENDLALGVQTLHHARNKYP
jgi:hypothetical protein